MLQVVGAGQTLKLRSQNKEINNGSGLDNVPVTTNNYAW